MLSGSHPNLLRPPIPFALPLLRNRAVRSSQPSNAGPRRHGLPHAGCHGQPLAPSLLEHSTTGTHIQPMEHPVGLLPREEQVREDFAINVDRSASSCRAAA
jgi:hypothetical protein